MRNGNKLKLILSKYDLTITLPEEELFRIIMIDKMTNEQFIVEGDGYTRALDRAYYRMMGKIRAEEGKGK